jgi:DNA-binding transcriptional regulator LsrR (DeoR family)
VLGRVAELHYKHDMTHQEIANIIGVSRVQVTRMLAKARAEGIVEFIVHSDESIFPELQAELADLLRITQAWISPSFDDEAKNLDSLGAVAAQFLVSVLKPTDVVAVGLSATLEYMLPHLKRATIGATFVPALGSRPGPALTVNPHEIANDLADRLGGTARHLPAPFLMASERSADMMRREPDVAATLELARTATLGLYGLGGTEPGTGPLIGALGPSGELENLVAKGAVGDISGIYFDAEGQYVPSSVERRIIGLSLDEIRAIPRRAVVARGMGKVDVITAAGRSGILTHLVTDQATAEEIVRRIRTS